MEKTKPVKLMPDNISVKKLTTERMSVFMKCIKTTMSDTYAAHPDYPKITTTHLQSFVKRFLGHWNKANEETNETTL
jgi:hypothetical protein